MLFSFCHILYTNLKSNSILGGYFGKNLFLCLLIVNFLRTRSRVAVLGTDAMVCDGGGRTYNSSPT